MSVSASEINNFCSSNTYYNSSRQRIARDNNQIINPEKTGNDLVLVKPNPNTSQFSLVLKKQNSPLLSIRIMDASGKVVYVSHEGKLALDAGITRNINLNLPNGVYLLIAITEKEGLKTKFIIAK
jgi:hypothetical protein